MISGYFQPKLVQFLLFGGISTLQSTKAYRNTKSTETQLYRGILITEGLPRLTFLRQLWSLAVNFPRQKSGLPREYRGKVATG